jgi:hypothetical protein
MIKVNHYIKILTIITFTGTALLFAWLGKSIYKYIDFQYHNSFTNGKIIGYDQDGTGNPLIVYTYQINNKTYTSNDYKNYHCEVNIGDTILIKYYSKELDFSKIIWDDCK